MVKILGGGAKTYFGPPTQIFGGGHGPPGPPPPPPVPPPLVKVATCMPLYVKVACRGSFSSCMRMSGQEMSKAISSQPKCVGTNSEASESSKDP